MKRLLGLVCCLLTGALYAEMSIQELFLRGNNLYQQGDYDGALEQYHTIPEKSSAVQYNIGNTLFKQHEYVPALIAYLRAERGATRKQLNACEHNIDAVCRALGRPALRSWSRSAELYLKSVPFLFFQVGLLLLVVLFVVYLIYWRQRNLLILICLGGVLMLCAWGTLLKYGAHHRVIAVVCEKKVPLYGAPNEQVHTVGEVVCGDCVVVLTLQSGDATGGWCRVRCATGTAWLKQEWLEVL